MTPALRDAQRETFRTDNEDVLMQIADAIATVLDTALAAKDATTKTLEVASELRAMAGQGGTSQSLINISNKTPAVLDALEKINKAYAAFQLVRDAVDAIGGDKTEAGSARKGVALMSTAVSAGGTLLNASAGFTLYANLYMGPMVGAILSMLGKIENMLSRSDNRQKIEGGMFDLVRWQLEPGGRPVFDFMLALMRAGGPEGVPSPPQMVKDFFIDQQDSLEAGVGGKDEMPTTGWWFWEDVDESKIKRWAFRNRQNLWGMLYGACAVPG